MKTIMFNEKEYQCPECWCEVSLGMLIKTSELNDILVDAPIVAIVAGYTGIPTQELKLSNLSEISPILEILDFIYEEYKPVPSNSFEFKGKLYSTKPDLAECNFEDWVSIQTILYNNRDNPVMGLPKIIATFCKQEGETLDSFDLEDRAKYFMDLPLPTAKDIEGFFLSNLIAYKSISQLSSIIKEQEKLILSTLTELDSTMIKRKEQSGTSFFTKFQISIYRMYIRYLKRGLERYFNYGPSKSSKRSFKRILTNLHIRKFNKKINE